MELLRCSDLLTDRFASPSPEVFLPAITQPFFFFRMILLSRVFDIRNDIVQAVRHVLELSHESRVDSFR